MIRTEIHPRFYTDWTGTVPVAMPALIRHWGPTMYFMVFKAPDEGRRHIFRKDEPFMQVSVVSVEADFELMAMNEEEAPSANSNRDASTPAARRWRRARSGPRRPTPCSAEPTGAS